MIKFTLDKTGFPLIVSKEIGVAFHLIPITKVQFEEFISETNKYGDEWYETILSINPRVSYKLFDIENYEHIFITGILPEEALEFAKWLGKGFDLPTVKEWRQIYLLLQSLSPLPLSYNYNILSYKADKILKKLNKLFEKNLNMTLMEEGIVEWVRQEKEYIGLGAPRDSFLPNAWNPLKDEVRPINIKERLKYFGFRLVRRL
ncbi:MAG: SUMF1/EgtB/PvdO family nonheme iron enzyme [Methanosarcinales archaeon]